MRTEQTPGGWIAIPDDYDGAPDSPTRALIGHGKTEREAIDDLQFQLSDDAPQDHATPHDRH